MAQDAEPTRFQISAFDALLKADVDLNVDFAVWVQYGDRLLKKRAVDGWKMGPNGVWVPIQLYGPPSIHDWRKCFKVFRSAALGFDAIDMEWLERYPERFSGWADQYPLECWALLYQNEARTRGEHMVRVRRRLEMEYEAARAKGESHPFDPARPWNETFKALCLSEDKWWFENVKEPCGFIYTKTEAPAQRVAGDQPVMGTRPAAAHPPPAAVRPQQDVRQPVHPPPAPASGQHRTHNNRDTELCRGYQTGACTERVGNRCARNKQLAHQCAICLDNRHGAHECPKQQGGGQQAPVRKNRGSKRKAKYGQ